MKLAHQMPDPLVAEKRRSCRHPHTMHFRVNQRVQPEQPGEVWVVFGDGLKVLGGNELDDAFADGHDVMVQMLEQEGVKVDEISSDMERADDTLRAPDGVGAHRHTLHQEAASLWSCAFGDDPLTMSVNRLRRRQPT